MTNPRGFAIVLAIACAAACNGAAAQSGGAPSKEDAFYTLTLQEGIAPTGKLGGFYGRADATGHRIVAENLSVVQPVTVLLIAQDPSEPLRADLVKGAWDQTMRSGTTGADGRLVFKTRTEGGMGILVRSASGNPASYILAVWAGDETPSEPTPIFTTARAASNASGSDSAGGEAGDTTYLSGRSLWLAGGGLIVLAVVGVVMMRRRRTDTREVEP